MSKGVQKVRQLTGLFLVVAIIRPAVGAELQLRDTIHTPGPLVLLGDIADIHAIHSVEAAELAATDLLPAPPAGEKRVLRLREVQDLLAVRGVNLAVHRFSGASQVVVHGPKREPAAVPVKPTSSAILSPEPRTSVSRKLAKQPIVEASRAAIETYLNEAAGDQGWQIGLTLSDERAERIAQLGKALTVTGGSAPWTGKQQFLINAENSDESPIQLTAEVAIPPAIVVARYSLPKGVILRADDLTLQRGLPTQGEAEVYQSIDDVVGKETTRMVTEGQILDSRSVRRQLLVRRNEIVTLYSRAGGVSVRTTARVRGDGAEGDLVTVETLEDRKPLFARVSGPQEVEIFAQAVSSAEPNQQATRTATRQSSRPVPPAPLPVKDALTTASNRTASNR